MHRRAGCSLLLGLVCRPGISRWSHIPGEAQLSLGSFSRSAQVQTLKGGKQTNGNGYELGYPVPQHGGLVPTEPV